MIWPDGDREKAEVGANPHEWGRGSIVRHVCAAYTVHPAGGAPLVHYVRTRSRSERSENAGHGHVTRYPRTDALWTAVPDGENSLSVAVPPVVDTTSTLAAFGAALRPTPALHRKSDSRTASRARPLSRGPAASPIPTQHPLAGTPGNTTGVSWFGSYFTQQVRLNIIRSACEGVITEDQANPLPCTQSGLH